MAFLELTNVRKAFAEPAAVDTSTSKPKPESSSPSSGHRAVAKTTTLRMIAGFEIPTSGTIVIDGKDMTTVPPNKRNVGMVFQSYALFPNLTVAGNIGFWHDDRGQTQG